MFFIDAGLVKLTRTSANGSRQILSVLGSHQLAGEECLLGDAGPYRSDAECLTDVTVYSVPVATVMRLFGIPDFAAALVSYAVRRDFDYIQKVELLARYDVEHRILHGLAELACLVTPTSDGAYQIPMIQAEIASFVGRHSRDHIHHAQRTANPKAGDTVAASGHHRSPRHPHQCRERSAHPQPRRHRLAALPHAFASWCVTLLLPLAD